MFLKLCEWKILLLSYIYGKMDCELVMGCLAGKLIKFVYIFLELYSSCVV